MAEAPLPVEQAATRPAQLAPFAAASANGTVAPIPSIEAGATVTPHDSKGPIYSLVLLRKNGPHRDAEALVPVRGTGYETVRAFVLLKDKLRRHSPVAGVKAHCTSATRCEYLPPRKAGSADRYVISLSDDSIATLSPMNDMIAISTRQLDVGEPITISVILTIPGQPPVTRQITYTKATG